PAVISGPCQLWVLALQLCEDARWNDSGANQIVAHGRRPLSGKLQVGVFLAHAVGMAEYPDVGVTALPRSDEMVECGAAILVYPSLVNAEIHAVSTRRIDAWACQF